MRGPEGASRVPKIAFLERFPFKKGLAHFFMGLVFCMTLSCASLMPCAKEKSRPSFLKALKELQGFHKQTFFQRFPFKKRLPILFWDFTSPSFILSKKLAVRERYGLVGSGGVIILNDSARSIIVIKLYFNYFQFF